MMGWYPVGRVVGAHGDLRNVRREFPWIPTVVLAWIIAGPHGMPRKSHETRWVCSWDPAGTTGITHGIPRDVVKKTWVPAMAQGNLTGSREVPRDPTESCGKSRGNQVKNTVMLIATVGGGGGSVRKREVLTT